MHFDNVWQMAMGWLAPRRARAVGLISFVFLIFLGFLVPGKAGPAAASDLESTFGKIMVLAASFPDDIMDLTDAEKGPLGLSGAAEEEFLLQEVVPDVADTLQGWIVFRNDPTNMVGFACTRFGAETYAALQAQSRATGGSLSQHIIEKFADIPETAVAFQSCTVLLPIMDAPDNSVILDKLIDADFQPLPVWDHAPEWKRGAGALALRDGIVGSIAARITTQDNQAMLWVHVEAYVPSSGS